MFQSKFLKALALLLVACMIGATGYAFGVNQIREPHEDGTLTKEAAARAVAEDFASPQSQLAFSNQLLNKRFQKFDGGNFSCVKFYPDKLAFGYAHVACDFGDGQIEVHSF